MRMTRKAHILERMVKTLAKEFDPRHDFDRVGYFSDVAEQRTQGFKEFALQTLRVGYQGVNFAKHAVRGSLAGAGIGALVGALSEMSVAEGARNGAEIGLGVDMLQYQFRGMFYKPTGQLLRYAGQHFNPWHNRQQG